METTIAETAVSGAAEISLWHLIMQASWPVFFVMIVLALASIWCWAIIIENLFTFGSDRAVIARC